MVIDIPRKNSKVLMEIGPGPKGPKTIHRARQVNLNLNFDFITSTHDTHREHHYRYCLEYGYGLGDGKVMVVVSDPQMEQI
jgi:hypothetical protein